MSVPRIPPRPYEDWDAEVFDALSALQFAGASNDSDEAEAPPPAPEPPAADEAPRAPSAILATFAWHPDLTKGWLLFNNHLFHSTLSGRVRELAETRILWLRRAEYEFSHHVNLSRDVGMSEEEILGICEGPDAKVWGPLDRALLQGVDELCFDRNISDETWAVLAEHLDRKQLMDFVFSVGAYDLLAMSFHVFGLQMEPGMLGYGQLPEDVQKQAAKPDPRSSSSK